MGESREKLIGEQRDVLAAIAQRRHDDVDDVQAIEQILAERSLRDHVAKVLVGRGNHANVDGAAAAVGADFLQFACFEEAQQKTLHAQRHLADFVEEDGPVVRGFELSRLVAVGAGEASTNVSEQFRFEQRFRKAGAVDGRERHGGARALVMNALRDDLFAAAALARHEHLRVRPRDAIDFLAERHDVRALTEQPHGILRRRHRRRPLTRTFIGA